MTLRQNEIPADRWVRPTDLLSIDLERPVCLINGAFDIIHSSHLRLIHEAKLRAKTIVACLDSDEKVRRTKGKGRPVFYWTERATNMVYLGIDWVVEVNTDTDFIAAVNATEPDFRVLGGEYKKHKSRLGNKIPTIYIREGGAHTTTIIQRILSVYGENK